MGLNSTDLCSTLEAIRAGSPAAVGVLYEAYGAAVCRYCYARLGDAEAAQDCTQEVFVHMWQGMHSFKYRGKASFMAWVYTIARRIVVSYVRTQLRARHVSLLPELNLADDRTSDLAGTSADRVLVAAAIRQLTVEQQQVITLKFFGGLSNREIATALGRTEGAVKSLQHRALNRLQKLLSTKHADQPMVLPRQPRSIATTVVDY
jgi:RNA polymerase sigma-70 factor (ECF subfamily)